MRVFIRTKSLLLPEPTKESETQVGGSDEPNLVKNVQSSAFASEVSKELKSLKKPSRFFVTALSSSVVVAAIMIALILLLSR